MRPPRLLRLSLRFKIIFFWGFFFLIILGGLFLKQKLVVKEIIVSGVGEKINIIGLNQLQNQSLIFLDESRWTEVLLKKNPILKKVTLQKKFPDRLIIKVVKDLPLAVLKTSSGFFFLSDEGKIVFKKKRNQTGLPVINFYQSFYYHQHQSGEKLNYREILTTLRWLKSIDKIGLKADSVDITGVYMVAFNLGEKKILFSLEKDFRLQEYQLMTVIKQFKMEGREFTVLDFRFDKPVVRF